MTDCLGVIRTWLLLGWHGMDGPRNEGVEN